MLKMRLDRSLNIEVFCSNLEMKWKYGMDRSSKQENNKNKQ
jgi:hypothetical protein